MRKEQGKSALARAKQTRGNDKENRTRKALTKVGEKDEGRAKK